MYKLLLIRPFYIYRHVTNDSVNSSIPPDKAIILINLCVALILSYILFLAGVTQTGNKVTMINVIPIFVYIHGR
jgi:hypothetical protein